MATRQWNVHRNNNYLFIDEDAPEGIREVARIGLLFDDNKNEPHRADAHLIAAAPDLLAALETLETRLRAIAEEIGTDCVEGDWADIARTAIQRAKEG